MAELETFHDELEVERMAANDSHRDPIVEASRVVINHLNRGRLEGFEKNGYMMYRDVIVCDVGKKEDILAQRDRLQSMTPYDLGQNKA